MNSYHHPNVTNLHLHGLHIDPKQPGDDVLIRVQPGMSFQYEYSIPSDHSPGTYWYHPHHHGSGLLQTGAGAAGVFLVQDPPGFLSPQLESMEDRLLVMQEINHGLLQAAASKSRDKLFRVNRWGWEADKILVNGAPRPKITASNGTWQRLRLVMIGEGKWLNLDFGRCEVALLAKDGIYINDFPRFVPHVMLPPGARADVVVRCPADGSSETEYPVFSRPRPGSKGLRTLTGHIFTIVAKASTLAQRPSSGLASGELQAWSPPTPRPAYLEDLRSKAVPNCTCETQMGIHGSGRWINGHLFEGPHNYLHRSPKGAVVERWLGGVDTHTYHQHTWPFQLQQAPSGDDPYFKPGDWHDTYLNVMDSHALVRFHTVDFSGPMVLHCHSLAHEDQGMMAVEMVGDQETCGCGFVGVEAPAAATAAAGVDSPGSVQERALIACASVGFLATLALSLGVGSRLIWSASHMSEEGFYAALPGSAGVPKGAEKDSAKDAANAKIDV
jgi:FtsP/CotA-like multicopper oxidase with cupredoxin domain